MECGEVVCKLVVLLVVVSGGGILRCGIEESRVEENEGAAGWY